MTAPKPPRLSISPYAVTVWRLLAQHLNTEVGLLPVIHEPTSTITDLLVPPQEASVGHFTFLDESPPEEISPFQQWFRSTLRTINEPYYLERNIVFHTHPGESATPSSGDDGDFNDHCTQPYYAQGIMGKTGLMTFRFLFCSPSPLFPYVTVTQALPVSYSPTLALPAIDPAALLASAREQIRSPQARSVPFGFAAHTASTPNHYRHNLDNDSWYVNDDKPSPSDPIYTQLITAMKREAHIHISWEPELAELMCYYISRPTDELRTLLSNRKYGDKIIDICISLLLPIRNRYHTFEPKLPLFPPNHTPLHPTLKPAPDAPPSAPPPTATKLLRTSDPVDDYFVLSEWIYDVLATEATDDGGDLYSFNLNHNHLTRISEYLADVASNPDQNPHDYFSLLELIEDLDLITYTQYSNPRDLAALIECIIDSASPAPLSTGDSNDAD